MMLRKKNGEETIQISLQEKTHLFRCIDALIELFRRDEARKAKSAKNPYILAWYDGSQAWWIEEKAKIKE